MRRILCVLLLLALLPVCAGAEQTITDVRAHALELFYVCAFTEPDGSESPTFTRWNGPIRIYLDFADYATVVSTYKTDRPDPKPYKAFMADVRKDLEGLAADLQRMVPFMPPLTLVDAAEDANLVIHYYRTEWLPDRMPADGDRPMKPDRYACALQYKGSAIVSADIAISTDKEFKPQRTAMLRTTLMLALGFSSTHSLYPDSVLCRGSSNTKLSDLDLLMLNYLYFPLLESGDNWDTVDRKLRDYFGLPTAPSPEETP